MSVHDEKIERLLEEVNKRKAELGSRPKNVLKTNGILRFSDRDHINLNTVNDIDVAINALAQILGNKFAYEEACKQLGVKSKEFNYSGFPVEDWIEDLKFRVDVINWNAKQAELNTMTRKLEGLISEEAKTNKELASIESLLNG